MADEPDRVAEQQERGANEAGQRGVRRASEPQLAGQPDHHQRHRDKGKHRHSHLFQPRPDDGQQQRAEDQQHQRQRPEERQRQLAGKPDGVEQVGEKERPHGVHHPLPGQ